jgi:hypothetical protein
VAFWHWLAVVTGGSWPGAVPTAWYNEWSGFLGDLAVFGLLVTFGAHVRLAWSTATCHARWWCPRRGTHLLGDGSPWRFCRVHHPDDIPAAREALAAAIAERGE